MADATRHQLNLRTITVSTRAALDSVAGNERAAAVVKARSEDLLAELERRVRDNGNDPDVLAGIGRARRALDGAAPGDDPRPRALPTPSDRRASVR